MQSNGYIFKILTVIFSKFTLNIKIYDEFVGFLFKLVWREILFHRPFHQKKKKKNIF